MKINFKTSGIMSDLLLPGLNDDQAEIDVAEGATITDVIAQLDLPEDDFYLIILNDVVSPKVARSTTVLNAGDNLGIFPPLKGG